MTDQPNFVGCDELREWLVSQGYKPYLSVDSHNECNWIACKQTAIPSRECEYNNGLPVQIVVTPILRDIADLEKGQYQDVEVSITGEASEVWYTLKSSGMRHAELKQRLHDIEKSLVAAWNAIHPSFTETA